ncbi:hypothetical protein [Curtobacterium pusillum]|uniref:hypothetical protein n=1 Tax=Curtobacterium pusillum TaxID=69373 RepID=UPI0011A56F07|nr:hypothetical protein [Curtobacterium pusillum]
MSSAFTTGLRIVRAERSRFLAPVRLRRRTVLSGTVAGVVGAFLVVADRLWSFLEGPWPLHVLAVVVLAAALGCFVAAFVPVGGGTATTAAPPTGDWRRSERIDRQFAARPPEVLPADRDLVIDRAERAIGPAVVAASRFVWLPVAWIVAWAGLVASGLADVDRLTLLLVPPVFAVLQSASFVAAVTGAGRADAARRRALAVPSVPAVPAPDGRRRDPRGSKVELPDG